MNDHRRTVLIGLDGTPYSLISRLVSRGVMPRLASLLSECAFRRMTSSIPEVSSVAWSSMMTGTGPGHHGIFGFTELRPGSYSLTFPNFHSLKSEPFWRTLNRRGVRTCVINMPSTYPACALDGLLVAGFVAVDMNKAVYPESLIPLLTDMKYEIDVNAELAHSDMAQFMEHVNMTLDRRIAFCRWAWEQEAWGCFVFVITETDRVHHFLFPAFSDESHPFHDAVCRFYSRIDAAIGELTSHLSERDKLIIMSDHGFCNIRQEMYVNAWLREKGWLRLARTPPDGYEDIAEGTLAFALDPCRIYLNRKHAYPMGAVEPEDEAALLDDLQDQLESWTLGGEKVIKQVYRREELYSGPMLTSAPDLVAVPNDGFDVKASFKKEKTHGRSLFAGMHTREDAFLIVSGDDTLIPEAPDICDVRRIIEAD